MLTMGASPGEAGLGRLEPPFGVSFNQPPPSAVKMEDVQAPAGPVMTSFCWAMNAVFVPSW